MEPTMIRSHARTRPKRRPPRGHAIALALVVALGLAAAPAPAQDGAAPPTLDELLDLPPTDRPAPAEDTDSPEDADPAEGPDTAGLEELTEPNPADVFQQAIEEMGQAADRLDARDLSLSTQRVQESVIRKLELVIEAAGQQGGGGGQGQPQSGRQQDQGSQGNQGQPAQGGSPQGSQPNQGTPTTGSPMAPQSNAQALEEYRREWGHLPPRVRDELLQALQERFSSVYRRMTEQYYRRLAEENE
jgi:hypothetical protein